MRRIVKKIDRDSEVNMNIAPFIDVVFVLLIVFMIPSQTMFGNIELELPPANAKIAVLEKDPLKVMLDRYGNLNINNKSIKTNELIDVANELSLKDKSIKIYVIADKRNSYERVMNIVGMLNDAGFKDVVLISDLYNRL